MSNTVTLTVKINSDGGLELIGTKAEKAAAGLGKVDAAQEKAAKSGAKQTKQNKGVAGATSNSTKAFSKMTTGITGGLVPAYAVLAANVFALTAAFGALRRAAAFEQLEEGLIRVGNAAGSNLPYVAENLREITGAAVSMEAAMSSTALAFSSGFSSTQLEGLTKVAKGASQALGRDMEDALTRLVKGTAKLEPEILDELGIMVRLDDAVDAYATTLDKTGDQLTQFERRQAFLTATITQGEKKFGDVADAIDPNAYDQLAAAFNDLSKAAFGLMNNVLTPLVGFLASSPTALMGVLAAFGSTLLSTILPAIGQMSEGHQKAAKTAQISAKKASQVISKEYTTASKNVSDGLKIIPKSLKDLTPKIKAGTLSLKEQDKIVKVLKKSETLRAAQLAGGLDSTRIKRTAELQQIREQITLTQQLRNTEKQQGLQSQQAKRATGRGRSSTITAAALKRMDAADGIMGKFRAAVAGTNAQMKLVGKTSGTMWTKIRVGATAARGAVTLFGTALLNAIPIIGQILMVASLLWPVFQKMFGKGELESTLDKITDSFGSFARIGLQLKETLENTSSESERFVAILKVQVGVLNQIIAGYKKYNEAVKSGRIDNLIEKQRILTKAEEELANVRDNQGTRTTNQQIVTVERYTASVTAAQLVVDGLKSSLDAIDKDAAIIFTQQAIDNISASPELTKNMSLELAGLGVILEEVKNGAISTGEGLSTAITGVLGEKEKVLASIMLAQTVMADFTGAINKMGAKSSSPFDDLINKAKILQNEFTKAGELGTAGQDAFILSAVGLEEQLERVRDAYEIDERGGALSDNAAVDTLVAKLIEARDVIITTKAAIKTQGIEFKKLNKIAKANPDVMERALTIQESILDSKQLAIDKEIEIYTVAGTLVENAEQIKILNEQTNAILVERLLQGEKQATVDVARAEQAKRFNNIKAKEFASTKAIFDIETRMMKNAQTRMAADRGRDLTAVENLDTHNKNKKRRMDMIKQEETAKLITVGIEYDLLDAQLKLEKIKATRAGASVAELAQFATIANLYKDGRDAATDLVKKQAAGARDDDSTTGSVLQNTALQDSRTTGGTQGERLTAAMGTGGAFNNENASIGDKTAAAVNAMQPMIDLMGPEGALISAVTQGAVAITDAWSFAFDQMGKDGVSNMAVALEAGVATLGAIGSMMSASSSQRISAIDDEIAAEQKRDGQSAKSIAKIKQMEAKKEAMAKKAFNVNKAIQLAQVVMSTAAGVMNLWADPKMVASGMAATLTPWVIGLGAAQAAIIASTSYAGGGGKVSAGAPPSEISVGSRSNTVDLARGNNAGGELSYMRGDSGTGRGATDFTPSFSGSKYKSRFAGGTTRYKVGEQGPEMFIPDRPGRIATAGETQDMGAPTNISFNIQAVDAVGVENVLIQQKGHIIKMIREAANEHGEFFLENVREEAYEQ